MNIGLYYAGGMKNNFSGVYGLCTLMLEFAKELHSRGHDVINFSKDFVNDKKNVIVDSLIKDRLILDGNSFSRRAMDGESLDAILIEMRPKANETEFNEVCSLIDNNKRIPVFVWDADLWAKDLPQELREQVVLLRPYLKRNDAFDNQEEFHYFMSEDQFQVHTDKLFDFCYVGNQYGRQQKFNKFVGALDKEVNAVIGGNWLKPSKREESLKLENVLYIGEVPHSAAKQLLHLGSSTLQIVKPDYEQVGLMSYRIFEAASAGVLCFADKEIYGIEQFVPKELIISDGYELNHKIKEYKNMLNWFVERHRIQLRNHTASKRAEQFEQLVEEYS